MPGPTTYPGVVPTIGVSLYPGRGDSLVSDAASHRTLTASAVT